MDKMTAFHLRNTKKLNDPAPQKTSALLQIPCFESPEKEKKTVKKKK